MESLKGADRVRALVRDAAGAPLFLYVASAGDAAGLLRAAEGAGVKAAAVRVGPRVLLLATAAELLGRAGRPVRRGEVAALVPGSGDRAFA